MAEGRRQRVKERARREGINNFEPHELLELMLYPYVPRKDTKPIAVELLSTFGSLDGVLNATERDLLSIKGMTKEAAFHFSLYYRIFARARSEGVDKNKVLKNFEEAGKYVLERIGHLRHEEFLVICLDSKKRVVRTKSFTVEDPTKTDINIRLIVDTILGAKCVAVIVGHNHPSGELHPSGDDINATKLLFKLLESLGIKLYDHIIVNHKDCFSFVRSNLMKSITSIPMLNLADPSGDYE